MSSPARRKRLGSLLCNVGFVAVVVFWILVLCPQFLGGPAGYVTVAGTSMEPGMHTGDVVLMHRQDDYRRGDVIAYRVPRGQPGEGHVVIHRVVGGSATGGYVTRGDNREANDFWRPKPSDVIGEKRFMVPALAKISRMLLTPIGLGLLAALMTMVIIATAPAEPEPRVSARAARAARRAAA